MTQLPLVSVGIPLYRSKRFLDILIANIDSITYDNVEFIVSDRHLADDTLDLLRERFGADARFRFLGAKDELNWVAHFNLLLRESRGKYTLWMAHDDSYPSNYIPDLVDALEADPDAVLAFGRCEELSLDGFLPVFPFTEPPIQPGEPWTIDSAVRLLTLWQLWIAFRGLARRAVVEERELYIRATFRNVRADIYWLFALALRGRFLFVPTCHCTKRFYRSSGGAGWRFGMRQSLDAWQVLRGYLNEGARPGWERFRAMVTITAWVWIQGLLPAAVARQLGILTRRVLLGISGRPA